MPIYVYECSDCGVMEVFQGIKDDRLLVCPECNKEDLEKLITLPAGFVLNNREANQYNDILKAKYWRDKNGVRHKVGPGDGHSGSGTVSKQEVSPEVAEARKKRGKQLSRQRRLRQR